MTMMMTMMMMMMMMMMMTIIKMMLELTPEVNIWSRVLTPAQVSLWQNCSTALTGDLVDWSQARLRITGLNISQVEREEICSVKSGRREKEYQAYDVGLDFHQTGRFCANLGGSMAVARSAAVLQEVEEELAATCTDWPGFFTGFTHQGDSSSIYMMKNMMMMMMRRRGGGRGGGGGGEK